MKKNWIYKPLAERHKIYDTNADKPVVIVKGWDNPKGFTAKDKNGRNIAKFEYKGSIHDEGIDFVYRYTGMWGYELAELAMKRTGSPHIYFEGNRVHPAFRDGSYRQ